MKKPLKKIKTDKSAKGILKQDLSHFINAKNFKLARFELKPKSQTVTLRISKELLKALKAKAKKQGVNYQKLMRQAIEQAL